ncbi:hypothetical protein GCM10023322_54130 [Rugosimonospora acidiphila]|uniref:Uncharacterized protein n=1 Tax=Rugosimonospora acidiphila TaxID=556531 RepID=A0ABP9SB46_9ACTN
MNSRSWAALAVAALIAGLIAGCSSSSHPAPSPTGSANADERLVDGSALIIQCALTNGLMEPPTGLATPPGQTPWVEGTKLTITSANMITFNNWYAGVVDVTIAGKEIVDWVQETATSGKLPAAVCGTSQTTSVLQKQVFANDPDAGNPW